MLPIIARPRGNRISAIVDLPKGYASYSFRMFFVPIEEKMSGENKRSFIDAIRACSYGISELHRYSGRGHCHLVTHELTKCVIVIEPRKPKTEAVIE